MELIKGSPVQSRTIDPRTNSTILGVFRGAENDAVKIPNRSGLYKVDF